jgi:tetratricopeptide (TPR) repeat protein
LAVIYRDRGEYTSSQALFDQALALAARPQYQSYSSQLPVLYTNQGKLFYLTGKYREARVFLNMAMEE